MLFVQVAAAHVLVRAAVTAFASRHAVTFGAEVHPEARCSDLLLTLGRLKPGVHLLVGLVEVLRSVVCAAKRRSVEVIEHQVHIFCLLVLQVVSDLDVSVHLNFDVSIGLP